MTRGARWLIVSVAAILAMAAAVYGVGRWGRARSLPDGLLQASGRLEGDEMAVAAKFAGRIRAVLVDEGQAVTAGQPLAEMDDDQVRTRVDQAVHGEAVLRAEWEAARAAVVTLELEVPLSIEAAEADARRAEANVAKAQAAEQQAGRDAARYRDLVSRGSIGAQQSEAADLTWTLAVRDVEAARAAKAHSDRQLAQARLGPRRVVAQRHQVAAVEARLAQARAAVADARSVLADLTITAPAAGVVLTRLVDPGEVVPAGAPLFSLVDLGRLYLKIYVPEREIGKMRLGLPARVFIDAFPERPFDATVRAIAPRAEFTPKDVETRDERVTLVYAVKLALRENPEQRLTPGLPADAIIQCEPEVPWVTPRR